MKITLASVWLLLVTPICYSVEIIYAEKAEVVAGSDSEKLVIAHKAFFSTHGFEHENVSCRTIIFYRNPDDSVEIAAEFEYNSVSLREGKKQMIPGTSWLWFNKLGRVINQAQARAVGNQIIPGNPEFSHSLEDKKAARK